MQTKNLVAIVAWLLVAAAPAYAHVKLVPAEAARGAIAEISFRVPNERADSGTVKVEVQLPVDHPLAVVEVKPKNGWTSSTESVALPAPLPDGRGGTVTERVSRITWEGGPISPRGTELFPIAVGPLPVDADRVFFKTLQTYASGEIVRWIEETPTGADRPAPILRLSGTAPPTTVPPTTAPPTTVSPTTVSPTTVPPTTAPASTSSPEATATAGDRRAQAGERASDSGGGGAPLVLAGVAAGLIAAGWFGLRRRRGSR